MKCEPFSLVAAWAQLGDLFTMMRNVFGAPLSIAEKLILVRKNRNDLLAWLGPLEALVRRLLLIEALALPPANVVQGKQTAGRLAIDFTDRPEPQLEAESAAWRVCFSVMPRDTMKRRRITAPVPARRGGQIAFTALVLARRMEALRRVLENRAPAVARLARLIAGRRELAERAFSPYRPPPGPVETLLAGAQEEIALAFDTS